MNPEKDILIAHDSITQYGGAERVFVSFTEAYPQAPIFTMVSDEHIEKLLKIKKPQVSWLQYLFNIVPKFQWWFPLVPFMLATVKLPNTKIILSSSSAYLKGIIKHPETVHINYCHTPTRFLWSDYSYALNEIHPLLQPIAKIYFGWLKKWDLRAAGMVDVFVANSKEVQKRIKMYYNRESELIYPFIDTAFWKSSKPKGDYFLIAGRLAPYKNHDKIIEIFNELGLPLHVVGEGRYQTYLKSIAKSNIVFLGRVSDEELRDQYSGALGFIYPQVEDFGLMPLEAAACGTPTIALAKAGSLETVVPGITGELLDQFTHDSLRQLIQRWDVAKYESVAMRSHAELFSKKIFLEKLQALVNRTYHEHFDRSA